MNNILYFKAVTFLYTMLNCEGREYYLKYGFSHQNMCEEVINLINCSSYISHKKLAEYKNLLEEDIIKIFEILEEEGLIINKNHLYYITETGKNVSKYVNAFSNNYTCMLKNEPFRFYPNSTDLYGLN